MSVVTLLSYVEVLDPIDTEIHAILGMKTRYCSHRRVDAPVLILATKVGLVGFGYTLFAELTLYMSNALFDFKITLCHKS